jgi:AcrR family transcriptional regulator
VPTPAPVRPYRGVAAEDRRSQRRAKLLEAGLDVLGTEGWQATTVRAICRRAGLTERYFYESFRDRDELVVAVFDEIAGEIAVAVLAAVADAPDDAYAKSRAAIAAAIELVTDDPRKGRVAFAEAMGNEALTRRRFEAVSMFAGLVAEQGRAFYGPGVAANPLVDTAALMLAGGVAETALAWINGELRITRAQLIDDCSELFATMGEAAARSRPQRSG